MSVRTDVVNLIVNVNGNNAQNDLNNLRKKAADLSFEMKGLVKGTAEYAAKATELKQVGAEMDKLKQQIGLTSLSQKELTAELNKLKALRGSVVPFSDEFKTLTKSIGDVESRLYDVRNGTQGFASMLSKLGDGVKQFGVLAAGYLGFQFITSQFTNIINGAGKLSDQLADLRRVAGLTAEEAQNLNKQLSGIDTRTSTGGLREISIVAGKLGVAKEDIFGFTKAVDQLVVTLGDELGNADQITTQLGKILNVFDGKVDGDNISKLGNAFVQLANTGAATGGFIADFDQRLSGMAKSAGISLGALSGLGAGLEEMGGRVESSATSVQKLIVKIAADIPAAAKTAGLSVKDFNQLFATDGTEAILKYSEGLVKNKKSFAEVTASLKDAGEEGARTIETLTKLGTGADKLRERIDLGKKSIEESSAITEAFAIKNETFGATIDKLGKEFNKFVTSSTLTSFLKGATEDFLSFLQVLKQVPKFIDDNSTALKFLVLGIALLNIQYIKSAVLIAFDTVLKVRNAIATKATAIATAIAEAATASYILVQNVLTGRIGLAIAAQRLWAAALSIGLGPLGIIITLVSAAVIALNSFTSSNTAANKTLAFQAETAADTAKELAKQRAELESLTSISKDNNISLETRETTLKKLIAISPEYLGRLTLETIATSDGKRIIDEYNKSLEATANIKAANAIRDREAEKDAILRAAKQEIEIAKKTGKGYGDLSSDAQNAFSKVTTSVGRTNITSSLFNASISDADYKEALTSLDKQISEEAKNVKAATDNFITQTQFQQDARRQFLIGEITAARTAQNAASDQVKKYAQGSKDYAAANLVYLKATDTLVAARKKFDDEFGNKQKVPFVAPPPPPSDEDDKASKKAQREYERLLKEAQKFQDDLLKLKQKAEIKGEAPEQGEIDAVKAKYAELIAKAKEFYLKHAIDQKQYGTNEKLIAEAQTQELQNIFEKYYKKRLEESGAKEYEDSLAARTEYSDQQKAAAAKDYADGKVSKHEYEEQIKQIEKDETHDRVIIAQDYSANVKKAATDLTAFKKAEEKKTTADLIEETTKRREDAAKDALAKAKRTVLTSRPGSDAEFEAKKALLKLEMDQELAAKDLTDQQLLLRTAQYNEDVKKLEKERVQYQIDQVMQYVDAFQSALGSLNQYITNKENAAFNKEVANNTKKKASYKNQLDGKLLSQQQYDKITQALQDEQDKKENELKHKQAERDKALNLFNAFISNSAAIVKTMSSVPYPFNIPLAIAQGIAGGLQIAAIANTDIPQLGLGDWMRKGDKHSDPSGGINAKIERDEAVMSARAMNNKNTYTVTGTTAQITSALNSRAGGVNWAGGAVVQMPKWLTDRPITINPNLPRIMEQGGIVRPLDPSRDPLTGTDELATLNRQNNTLMQQLIDVTKDKNDTLHAVVSIKEYEKTKALYNQAKKASGLG